MVDRQPSASLWDGQTDEDELGYTYNEMEPSIRICEANYDIMDKIQQNELLEFVWNRHKANKHKHEGPAITSLTTENFTY
jgi:NAD+ synthase